MSIETEMKRSKNKKLLVILTGTVIGIGYLSRNQFKSDINFDHQKFLAKKEELIDEKPDFLQRKIANSADHKRVNNIQPREALPNRKRQSLPVIPKRIIPKRNTRLEAEEGEDVFNLEPRQKYIKRSDIFALRKKNYNEVPNDVEVLDEKFGYYIVRSESRTLDEAISVVEVKGSQALGIFTGVLKVKFDNYEKGISFINNNRFQIIEEYDHINIVLLKFDSYEQTMEAFDIFNNHGNSMRVDIEVLQYERVSI